MYFIQLQFNEHEIICFYSFKMSDNSPPSKKLKKEISSEVSSSKIGNFLENIAAERKKVSKSYG